MKRVAINGFGRIGRCVLRALHERQQEFDYQVVAINEPADLDTIIYLASYDSTHGRLAATLSKLNSGFELDGQPISVSHETDIARLPWREQDIDLVLECSGVHNDRAAGEAHLAAGAKRLLYSHPATPDIDQTIVCGVNDDQLGVGDTLVSAASCTTNCIVPVLAALDSEFQISAGHLTTLHSMMNDQPVIDAYHHTDLRKTRSASQSLIPVDTALARGIERILPALKDKLSARAVRVPTTNVSAIDLVVKVERPVSAAQVNAVLNQHSESSLRGILDYTTEPLASCDFNHDPHSGIVDASQTSVSGETLIKVLIWFDNEWGFANRMLEVSQRMVRLL